MFEKSKRSLISATRGGTYRVHDSSNILTSSSSQHPGASTANETRTSGSLSGILRTSNPGRPKYLSITVIFLDDTQHTFEIEKHAKGSVLLDKVFQHLELIERDYFGLQFDELLPPPEVVHPLSSPHLRWIESSKALKKQIRFTKPTSPNTIPQHSNQSFNNLTESASLRKLRLSKKRDGDFIRPNNSTNVPHHHHHHQQQQLPSATVYFRVKFFVEDPSRLNEEYTRYHVYLQVRKDIREGRLSVSPSSACLLASYSVQSELGDFVPEEHDEYGYYLKNVDELNYSGAGASSGEDASWLRKISQLHKMHKGQTPADAEYNYLDHAKRLDGYGVAYHRVKDNAGKEIQVGVSSSGLGVYHNGIKINNFSWSKITKIAFKRKHFFIQLKREISEEYDTLLMFDCFQYRSCKRLWKSCVEHHGFFRLSTAPAPSRSKSNLLLLTLGSKFRYSGRTEYQTREEKPYHKSRDENQRTFFRSPSKRLIFLRQTLRGKHHQQQQQQNFPTHGTETTDPNNIALEHQNGHASLDLTSTSSDSPDSIPYPPLGGPSLMHRSANIMNLKAVTMSGVGGGTDNKVQDKYGEKEPRKAWGETIGFSDDEGGFLDRNSGQSTPFNIPIRGIAFADDDEFSQSEHDGTVTIRLEPDYAGKFGFNVKGGYDMGCPVLVSRVAPNTPADKCYPKLTEGDQLIAINGKDTSTMPHREVVSSIRHAANVRKELILRVRQNVYTTDDYEEPAFQYVPDFPLVHLVPSSTANGILQSPLSSSMLLLAESIESDSVSSQFELIFRKKPGLHCEDAKLLENISKNRYRDILPYDSTRVFLKSSPNGNYINANYVTMEIPASGVVNRYIASQGPLSTTCIDFWIMVWESQSPLIVMLTPICERGRIKCHPYWPQNLHACVVYHNVEVQTLEETNLPHWIERKFSVKHLESGEERIVLQLQFQSWPDHGVPDDPLSFIRFVEQVRKAKDGTVEPTIIHCSAGIGRTGVLILMETAECLIEANQPVYPLDIVSQMRNQRPLMIQTPSQYRFVCQCALKVYQQGIIRPLPEFVSPSSAQLRSNIFNLWNHPN